MHYVEVDGVKVFEPTFEEFQDFGQCVREIERQGAATTGVAKVIPPKEWKARRDYTAVEEDEFIIPAPISQLFQGRQGLYEQYNILQKPTTVKEFKILANSERRDLECLVPAKKILSLMMCFVYLSYMCLTIVNVFNHLGTWK